MSSFYSVVNNDLVKKEKVHTKKAQTVAWVIAMENHGLIYKPFLDSCLRGLNVNKPAQAKLSFMLTVAFDKTTDDAGIVTYRLPGTPIPSMFPALYSLSHAPDRVAIRQVFGQTAGNGHAMRLKIAQLETDNRVMANCGVAAAYAAEEIKENAEMALQDIRKEIIGHYADFMGKVDGTLARGFKVIIRDVNRATKGSLTFPVYDGKERDFGDVWEFIDDIIDAADRYNTTDET